ncbi:MAG: DEAD/DEAH box helicase [Deltaproteobacteria bacterium]|nr:DEAD/DEAH box helicase [Deltaproteobacteria bacterium]
MPTNPPTNLPENIPTAPTTDLPTIPTEAPELFSDLPAPIARALARRGFTELTAVQRAVVEAEHEGRDLRISSQTGSGKTVAIGLALATHFLERPAEPATRAPGDPAAHPRALVVVPTRELAAQVREELRWLFAELPGATVEVVTGGTAIGRERIALSRRPAFVVGTPGRLLDHMRNGALACDVVEHVILDEADQMLDMGFKDELDAILEQLPEKRSSHLVSATFPHAVKALANRFQRDAMTLEGTKLGLANPDIEHVAYTIRRHETYPALINVLLLAGDSRCLLFVNRRVDATELAEKLAADGFGAAPFSGELPQAQRTRTLAAFRNGILPILVSTDVAARGIDVPEISAVIHVDPPKNPDAYVHRSGRTGRAGRAGRSILLVEGSESRKVGRMLSATRVAVSWQRVPTREVVERALDDQAQRALATRLEEASPTESQRMAAKELLSERDPIEVVATLLELAKPMPPRAPMEVQGLDPYVDEGRGKRGAKSRDGRSGEFERPARAPRAERRPPGSFTPFVVSYGERVGATTPRLLSHVCRRGGITSDQIGAIRVFAKNSIVEVANEVAEAFEARTREPDERDPGILIERARAESAERSRAAARPIAQRAPRSFDRDAERSPERSSARSSDRPTGPAAGRHAASRPASARPTERRPHAGPKRHPVAEEAAKAFDRRGADKPPFQVRRVAGKGGTRERAPFWADRGRAPEESGPGAPRDRKSAPAHARKPKPGFAASGPGGPKRAFKTPHRPGSDARPERGAGGFDPYKKARRKAGPGGPSGSPKR